MEIMVDIETLSSDTDAVVTSIGAVKFEFGKLQTVDEILAGGYFQHHVNAAQQERDGRKVSVSTALWWMQQNDAAKQDLIKGQEENSAASVTNPLDAFSVYCQGANNIWGNGNTFDNMVLRSLYKHYGTKYPVSFRSDLDFRTLKYIARLRFPEWEIPYPKYGEFKDTAHVGYIDAACQAFSAQRIYQKLNEGNK